MAMRRSLPLGFRLPIDMGTSTVPRPLECALCLRERVGAGNRQAFAAAGHRDGGSARVRREVALERIERATAILVGEECEIGARHLVAIAQNDMACDRLEARAEVLARLDQHVSCAS